MKSPVEVFHYLDKPAPNAFGVRIGHTSLYFSYQTLVAIRQDSKLYVVANYWGKTTGKHLNAIDGGKKGDRLDLDDFHQIAGSILEDVGRDLAKIDRQALTA